MSMNETCIYALVDPRSEEVKYVGKSNNPKRRLRDHIKGFGVRHNLDKKRWLDELLSLGLEPKITILERCDLSSWQEREVFWIAEMRKLGSPLTNRSNGGAGLGAHTKRTSRAIAIALSGKKLTDKHRANVSSALKGRKFSRAHREAISVAAKGKVMTGMAARGVTRPRWIGVKISEAKTGGVRSSSVREILYRQRREDFILAGKSEEEASELARVKHLSSFRPE